MPRITFDSNTFVKASGAFKARLAEEAVVSEHVSKAMSLLGDAAVDLVALAREADPGEGPVLTASISDSSVHIRGGNRNMMLAAAHGTGHDSHLVHPKFQVCGQVLVFGYLSGEDETTLLSSMRVYGSGDCTDGTTIWNLNEGKEAFLPYLSHLVTSAIFDCNMFWPELSQLPAYVQNMPILEEEVHDASLRKPCVGFECSLQGQTVDK
ncbi:MAG: hypothetical protein HY711_08320 [Candidatus Melainabacteria bacterium]|nr:hypothetical protein [Candidatus Melainabacteria bacterium]